MMDASREKSLMTVAIVECHMAQLDIVGNHDYSIIAQRIRSIKRCNCCFSLGDNYFTCKIDVVQRTCYTGVSLSMSVNAGEETTCEVVHKRNRCSFCFDSKVDILMHRRYMSVDIGLCIGTIVGNGVNIDLLQFLVPVSLSM